MDEDVAVGVGLLDVAVVVAVGLDCLQRLERGVRAAELGGGRLGGGVHEVDGGFVLCVLFDSGLEGFCRHCACAGGGSGFGLGLRHGGRIKLGDIDAQSVSFPIFRQTEIVSVFG